MKMTVPIHQRVDVHRKSWIESWNSMEKVVYEWMRFLRGKKMVNLLNSGNKKFCHDICNKKYKFSSTKIHDLDFK